MATIKFSIKSKELNSKGETIIYLRYGHKQKITDISTGLKTKLTEWNISKECFNSAKLIKNNKINEEKIKIAKKTDLLINTNLENKKAELLEVVRTLQLKGIDPIPSLVKATYLKKNKKKPDNKVKESAIKLFEEFKVKSNKSQATLSNYNTAIYHLKKYEEHKKTTLVVSDLNLGWYDDFTKFLFHDIEKPNGKKGLSDNSVGTSIKNIKVFLSYIKKRGYDIKNIEDFKVNKSSTPIYFLTEEEINKLLNHQFLEAHHEKIRDLFVFNCYTGLCLSDLERLNKGHINNGVIELRAYKNQNDIYAPLTPISTKILQKYDYVLPIISEQKYNKYIKEVCRIAGINKQVERIKNSSGKKEYEYVPKWKVISTHIAVKTFISLCGIKGISPKAVSEITGKTVNVILKHYYAIDKKTIRDQMLKAFG